MKRNGKPIKPRIMYPCPSCGQLAHDKWSVTSWPRDVWLCMHCMWNRDV